MLNIYIILFCPRARWKHCYLIYSVQRKKRTPQHSPPFFSPALGTGSSVICHCSKVCLGNGKSRWYRKESAEDNGQHRPQVWQRFSLSGKQMGRCSKQLSDGQPCVCRLLYLSSKKETVVAGLYFLQTQVFRLNSKMLICSQKRVTPHPQSLLMVKKEE